jgi:hypothetical protein
MNMSNRKEFNIFNNSKRQARLLSEYRSQNLKDNYKFDLNLHWMMMVRYIYDSAVSSMRELKILSSRIEWYTYICDNMLAIRKNAMSLRFKLHFVDGVLCYARVYSSVQPLAHFKKFYENFIATHFDRFQTQFYSRIIWQDAKEHTKLQRFYLACN